MQTYYSADVNKIIMQAKQKKAVSENLNVLIDLANMAMEVDDRGIPGEEPTNSNKAWDHPKMKLQ